jgi:hypothetical protein
MNKEKKIQNSSNFILAARVRSSRIRSRTVTIPNATLPQKGRSEGVFLSITARFLLLPSNGRNHQST